MKRTHTGPTGTWAHAFDYERFVLPTPGRAPSRQASMRRYVDAMIRTAADATWGRVRA
jgi:hypothetical protein